MKETTVVINGIAYVPVDFIPDSVTVAGIQYVKATKTTDEMSGGWQLISNGLPPDTTSVIIQHPCGDYMDAFVDDGEWNGYLHLGRSAVKLPFEPDRWLPIKRY